MIVVIEVDAVTSNVTVDVAVDVSPYAGSVTVSTVVNVEASYIVVVDVDVGAGLLAQYPR